jgi:hypothetical protein
MSIQFRHLLDGEVEITVTAFGFIHNSLTPNLLPEEKMYTANGAQVTGKSVLHNVLTLLVNSQLC